MHNDLMQAVGTLLTYSYQEMVINLIAALVIGYVISLTYRHTHKGLSYSQTFTQTLIYIAVIVSTIMMVIGSSLARAFALVGALSIIRFRTVIKDTKDIAFVFATLALGMACGTSNYFLAGVGTFFMVALSLVLHRTNYGALYKSEFILRFIFDQAYDSEHYLALIDGMSKNSNLLHIEPVAEGQFLKLTYDITLKEDYTAEELAQKLDQVEGATEVILIASKSDIDY